MHPKMKQFLMVIELTQLRRRVSFQVSLWTNETPLGNISSKDKIMSKPFG